MEKVKQKTERVVGAQRGLQAEGSASKSKGPGVGACMASQARRKAEEWTMAVDQGESQVLRSGQGVDRRTLQMTSHGFVLCPGQLENLWRILTCFFTSVLKNHSGC